MPCQLQIYFSNISRDKKCLPEQWSYAPFNYTTRYCNDGANSSCFVWHEIWASTLAFLGSRNCDEGAAAEGTIQVTLKEDIYLSFWEAAPQAILEMAVCFPPQQTTPPTPRTLSVESSHFIKQQGWKHYSFRLQSSRALPNRTRQSYASPSGKCSLPVKA